MATELDIANMALMHLGEDPLTQAQYDANTARRSVIVQQFLPTVRDLFMKSFPWNASVVRQTWAADTTTPAWGFDYEYTVPADCLRVLEVDGDPTFKREAGGKILTNEATIDVLYLAQITDYTLLNAEQALALATLLAATIAEPLTGKSDRTAGMMQLYQNRLLIAQGVDGQEGTPPTTYSSTLASER